MVSTIGSLTEPKLMATLPPLFPWQRFWVPLHGKIHLEQRGGFLPDPNDAFSKYLNPEVRTIEQVLPAGAGLTVLCGEPAMGKIRLVGDTGFAVLFGGVGHGAHYIVTAPRRRNAMSS